jgi:cysteine desulfurase
MFTKTKRVFLDYASTTPTDPRVLRAMLKYYIKKFANPSALYKEALITKEAVADARKKVAQITQTKPTEIIFTASGTESDNLAILGVARKAKKGHIITTQIEHVAVLETCRQLEKEGFDVTYLPVNENGIVVLSDLEKALQPDTILVSVMLANNEIGTIQPVRRAAVAVDRYKKKQGRPTSAFPYVHTDASQAPNYLDVNADALGVDLMTLDGSKIYGPKGVGCLIAKSHVPIQSIQFGGGQEMGLRPATENVPAIVGFAKTLEIADVEREKNSVKATRLQEYFFQQISEKIPQAKINGSIKNRMPNNINICIEGLNAEFAVIQLDEKGISCAAMTACKNLSGETSSYVIESLGADHGDCASSSLRFTIGRKKIRRDIDRTVKALLDIV